jgi:hypothetical protein
MGQTVGTQLVGRLVHSLLADVVTACCKLVDNLWEAVRKLLTACWQTCYKMWDFYACIWRIVQFSSCLPIGQNRITCQSMLWQWDRLVIKPSRSEARAIRINQQVQKQSFLKSFSMSAGEKKNASRKPFITGLLLNWFDLDEHIKSEIGESYGNSLF